MNERIRLLRKELGLNQSDFGNKIGVKQGTVAGYESGARTPLDAVVSSICREFDVNEEWLRTGEGEMFEELPEEDEVAAYVSDLLEDDENPLYDIIKDIMKTYSELTPKSQTAIRDFSAKLMENIKKGS